MPYNFRQRQALARMRLSPPWRRLLRRWQKRRLRAPMSNDPSVYARWRRRRVWDVVHAATRRLVYAAVWFAISALVYAWWRH